MTQLLSPDQKVWAFITAFFVGVPFLGVVVGRYASGEESFILALLMAAVPSLFCVLMWWGWYRDANEHEENLEEERLKRRGYQGVVESLDFDPKTVSFKDRDDLYRYQDSVEMEISSSKSGGVNR